MLKYGAPSREHASGRLEQELPLPRKIKVFDGGWKSDDTKVFDIDKGHTHTYISKYSQVS